MEESSLQRNPKGEAGCPNYFTDLSRGFHYSKQAFQLEADDYLNTDELTTEKLNDAVKKSLRWLKGRKNPLSVWH
jgi:hypothetical protein